MPGYEYANSLLVAGPMVLTMVVLAVFAAVELFGKKKL